MKFFLGVQILMLTKKKIKKNFFIFKNKGEMGIGNSISFSNFPVHLNKNGILKEKKISQISSGAKHNLILTEDNEIFGFGQNFFGQIGDGTNNDVFIPKIINENNILKGKKIIYISAGSFHS
jgi:alpha-tubulin suppressor-like RCC1 family protein